MAEASAPFNPDQMMHELAEGIAQLREILAPIDEAAAGYRKHMEEQGWSPDDCRAHGVRVPPDPDGQRDGRQVMSIYATYLSIDDDDHEPGCAKYEFLCRDTGQGWPKVAALLSLNGDYYRRVDKPCTCGNPGPVIYQGSHVNPADDDPRGGSVDLAAIPNFLHPKVREHRCETPDGDEDMRFPVDFLRLSVSEDPATYQYGQEGYAAVVLDRSQVEKVRDALTDWLETKERW